ncbi:MAG: 4-hydroxy-3-methylbut-2-enyl diphosphate reductase [Kiritimatiellae bacterium]|nr:4-hydroxy-3-methylbut-2-enyl diphosphate reductase [Kiritimatiellia bacterium]
MKIEVLSPHGPCAGVRAATALARRSPGACCLHQLVHSELVLDELKAHGVSFADSIEDVPDGGTVIFPAHGVSPAERRRAAEKGLAVLDATCPFVARAHRAARDFAARGLPVVVIGDPDHAEVKGVLAEIAEIPGSRALVLAPGSPVPRRPGDAWPNEALAPGTSIGVVSQTSMNADDVRANVEALRAQFTLAGVADVCAVTKERQDAVRRFDGDALLVLGSRSSANTRRLLEVARCPACLAANLAEVQSLAPLLEGCGRVGVTSGASAPEEFFDAAVRFLEGFEQPAQQFAACDGVVEGVVGRQAARRDGFDAPGKPQVRRQRFQGV